MIYKTIKTAHFLLLISLTIITSCSKDEDELNLKNNEQEKASIIRIENNSIENEYSNLSAEKISELLELDEEKISNEILLHINKHRNKIGKSSLISNKTAKIQAINHSNNQAITNHMSHDNISDRSSTLFFVEHASSYCENVGFGYFNIEKLIQSWINSKEHRANIEGDYTHTGIGTVANNKGVLYFTQEFFK